MTQSISRPAYGGRLDISRDNLYHFGTQGFIYTSPRVVTDRTRRHPAVILLTADGRSFRVGPSPNLFECRSAVVAPMVTRSLHAEDVPLISIHVQPNHPLFLQFCEIPGAIRTLERSAFRALDSELDRAYFGELSLAHARSLFERILALAIEQMPSAVPPDTRMHQLLTLFEERPDLSLSQMAKTMGMSYTGMSHMFKRSIGLSMRSYRLWLKSVAALDAFASDSTLTEIAHRAGFSDASQLSREWSRWYGMSPSHLRDERFVHIIR